MLKLPWSSLVRTELIPLVVLTIALTVQVASNVTRLEVRFQSVPLATTRSKETWIVTLVLLDTPALSKIFLKSPSVPWELTVSEIKLLALRVPQDIIVQPQPPPRDISVLLDPIVWVPRIRVLSARRVMLVLTVLLLSWRLVLRDHTLLPEVLNAPSAVQDIFVL